MAEISELPSKQIISLFDEGIELTLDPLFYLMIERLCKSALTHSLNHSDVRHNITNLYLYLSRESIEKHGVNSIDVWMLHKILYDQNQVIQPKPDIDILNVLSQGKRPRLGPDLVGAALIIRRIWQGFGKFLKLTSRNYSRSGPKKRTRSLDPIMIMSPELLNLWTDMYKPWFSRANREKVGEHPKLTHAMVVLRIILDDAIPEAIDKLFGLPRGMSMRILKHQLRLFIDPDYEARQAAQEAENQRLSA